MDTSFLNRVYSINPFHVTGLLLCPRKIPKNWRVYNFFRGVYIVCTPFYKWAVWSLQNTECWAPLNYGMRVVRKIGAGGRSKNGRGVVHSKVILVPQKMLNKTWIFEMAVCKAAGRGCNQNPRRTPVNYLFFL